MEVTYKLNLVRESDLLKYKQFYNCDNMAKAMTDFDDKLRQLEKNDTKNTKYSIDEIITMFHETINENSFYLEDIKEWQSTI